MLWQKPVGLLALLLPLLVKGTFLRPLWSITRRSRPGDVTREGKRCFMEFEEGLNNSKMLKGICSTMQSYRHTYYSLSVHSMLSTRNTSICKICRVSINKHIISNIICKKKYIKCEGCQSLPDVFDEKYPGSILVTFQPHLRSAVEILVILAHLVSAIAHIPNDKICPDEFIFFSGKGLLRKILSI